MWRRSRVYPKLRVKDTVMPNPTITIPIDPLTAQTYAAAGPDEKRKIQAVLSLWLR
jgi:hypothetical protein